MRPTRRENLLIGFALLLIAGSLALYAALLRNWLARKPPEAQREKVPAEAARELAAARASFRGNFLDPNAHLILAEALYRAGRPVDCFYLISEARRLFSREAFGRAHALILRRGEEQARLPAASDPLGDIPLHARLVHSEPDSALGRLALEELGGLAKKRAQGPGTEAARLAREALEELYRAHPKHPLIFSTLALSAWERGEIDTARALVIEALSRHPLHGGALAVEGALALHDLATDKALRLLTRAWEQNPGDLYSAGKLVLIHDKLRADREAALPYYIALYRHNPDYADGESAEGIIRQTLDQRRSRLLKHVGAEGLGRFLASEDASLRAESCVNAARFRDPRWIEALAELLDDDSELVRRNAAHALAQIAHAHPEAVRVRREGWLSQDQSPLRRAAALGLFAALGPRETLPLALGALKDPDPIVRFLVKTTVLDRAYRDLPAAARASMAAEKDPMVLGLYERVKTR